MAGILNYLTKCALSYKVSLESVCFVSVLSTGVTSLVWLMLAEPHFMLVEKHFSGPCPEIHGILGWRTAENITTQTPQISYRKVDCQKVIKGHEKEIQYATSLNYCQRKEQVDQIFLNEKNCDIIKNKINYSTRQPSKKEQDFPIAFSILTYEDTEQTLRLLRAIYQPQNVYCVHVDAKSPSAMYNVFKQVGGCFNNIVMPVSQVNVRWAEYSVLEAELLCMETLWNSSVKWKYYINLTGREFPLRTNAELVDILTVYNGANDIDGSWYNRNPDWMKYVWRNEYWRTNIEKEPVPHNFNIIKGSAHLTASRAFVDYALHGEKAVNLRNWMKDTRLPDEHYFNMLNHNPHFNISGAYTGDPHMKEFLTRFKIWQNDRSECSGRWSRYVCNLGARELRRVTQQRHLFINKLNMDVSSIAFQCLEQWHRNKTEKHHNSDFSLQYYKQLRFVKNHI